MSLREAFGLWALRRVDPETAHGFALSALRSGLAPLSGPVTSDALRTDLAGLQLDNPVGLAAGFDKNAEAIAPLSRAGFGFLEVGAATPRPQPGNPRPRLFRLSEDRASINRFGFNNDGATTIAGRLAMRSPSIPVGLNLGANKDSADRAGDYVKVLETCGRHVDFATVNVSSPNTERLRDLQGAEALRKLLADVLETRGQLPRPIPIFLKIAPDLETSEIAEIGAVGAEVGIDGLIATNTTLSRDGLKSRHAGEAGGLAGEPLFERSTRVLAQLSKATDGHIPLIGVGGVSSAETAYAKICAGASAVQLYTALVYSGLSLVPRIARGLENLARADGLETVSAAVGTRRDDWL